MYLSGIQYDSVVDGIGIRNTLFISGCKHNCHGCHNKNTHSFTNGVEFLDKEQDEFIDKCRKNPLLQGITISGGDPIFSSKDLLSFLRKYKKNIPEHDIWLYTGFIYENLIKEPTTLEVLKLCDVLVDGKFELSLRDITLPFRGSSNQRIINISESLHTGCVIEYKLRGH